jgi:metallophosphoesterase (TIGR00282 family)
MLPEVKKEYNVDFTIANAENAAGGFGLTPKVAQELYSYGIDLLTTGNHIFNKKEIFKIIDEEKRLLRPLNYPEGVPGRGSCIVNLKDDIYLGIINLSGRVFIENLDCPFRRVLPEINKIKQKTNVIIVDMHGEATSEKIAMGWYLSGKVSAVVGTHTHVQTADERIFPTGTAYITDIGMTGPKDSIIGIKIDKIIKRFLTQIPLRMEVAKGPGIFCGVIIDIDEKEGKARDIKRIQLSLEERRAA